MPNSKGYRKDVQELEVVGSVLAVDIELAESGRTQHQKNSSPRNTTESQTSIYNTSSISSSTFDRNACVIRRKLPTPTKN